MSSDKTPAQKMSSLEPKLTGPGIVQTLLETSPEAIFLETLEGDILDCNRTACQLYGYKEKAELINCQVQDIVPKEVSESLDQVISEEVATGGISTESWGKRKDGSLFQSHVTTRLLALPGKQLLVAHVRDITVEKELEKKRAAHQELTEALVKAAAVVNSHLRPDEVLDRILEQVARVVNGEAFSIMLIAQDKARIVRHRGYDQLKLGIEVSTRPIPLDKYPSLLKMIHTSAPVVIPDTLEDPTWVGSEDEWRRSYVGAPISIEGEAVGFLNVTSTEAGRFSSEDGSRLQAFAIQAGAAIRNARLHQQLYQHAAELEERVAERTAELEAQKTRLQTILQSVSDGIVVVNLQGETLLSNLLAEKWNTQLLSSADTQKLRGAIQTLVQEASVKPELTLELSEADLQLQAVPIPSTTEPQAIITIHDISELKSLERLKSQFISNISHELRTPLTTIKLYAQLLQYDSPDKKEEYLTILNNQIDYLVEMVEKILRYSRLSVQDVTLDLEQTDLNSLLKTIIAEKQTFIQQRELTLLFDPSPELPKIIADEEELRRVFLNLVNNALHYTPAGGEIQISTEITKEDGQHWALIKFKDSGFGIPNNELPHIFKRFYRGSKPRKEQIAGSGLGLSITKELVEIHGGWITVESKEDQGSLFIVWLPINRDKNG